MAQYLSLYELPLSWASRTILSCTQLKRLLVYRCLFLSLRCWLIGVEWVQIVVFFRNNNSGLRTHRLDASKSDSYEFMQWSLREHLKPIVMPWTTFSYLKGGLVHTLSNLSFHVYIFEQSVVVKSKDLESLLCVSKPHFYQLILIAVWLGPII